jgi:hypothetical protein
MQRRQAHPDMAGPCHDMSGRMSQSWSDATSTLKEREIV